MTHKEAPQLTDEQIVFESALKSAQENAGATASFSRDQNGRYHSEYARVCWLLWRKAVMHERSKNAGF